MTRTTPPCPALALAIAIAIAIASCTDDPDDALGAAPEGFDPAWSLGLRLRSEDARRTALPLDSPLYGPSNVAFSETPGPDGLPSIYVAEDRAWRVRRYPVRTLEPPALEPPTVAVTLTPDPDDEGVHVLSTRPDRQRLDPHMGRILEVGPEGILAVSSLNGDLWLVHPDQTPPRRLGAGPGAPSPAPGRDAHRVNLDGLAAAAFAPAIEGHPAALLIATPTRIFAADLDALLRGLPAPLQPVLGSGAVGLVADGVQARAATVALGSPGALADDGQGNLVVVAVDAGLLLWLPRWRDPDATVELIAGGGTSINVGVPDPRDAFLTLSPPGRPLIQTTPTGRAITFAVTGIPLRATFSLDGDAHIAQRQPLTFPESRQFLLGGMILLGDTLVVGDRNTGQLRAFPGPDAPLAGPPAAAPFLLPADPLRPAALQLYSAQGQERDILLLHDVATATTTPTLPERPLLDPLPYRPAGTDFAIPRGLAWLPASSTLLEGLLTHSDLRIEVRLVNATSATSLGGAGQGPGPAAELALSTFNPRQPPRLLHHPDHGVLLLDQDTATLAAIGDDPTPDTRLLQIAGGIPRPLLPLEKPIGRNVLDLAGLMDLTTHPDGLTLATLNTPRFGGLVVAITSGATTLAGADLLSNRATLLAGAGRLPLRDGRVATSVGLAAPSSAAALDQDLLLSDADAPNARLWRAGADATFHLLNPDPDPAHADPTPLRFLAPSAPLRLRAAPCLPPHTLLAIAPDATWLLNLGADPADYDADATPLPPGHATRLPAAPALDLACLGDAPRLAVRGEAGVELTGLDGRAIAPLPPATAALTATAERLFVAAPDLIALDPAELTPTPLSGLDTPTLHRVAVTDAGLTDDLPIFAGVPEAGIFGMIPGVLFRLVPSPSYARATPLEVLWSGDPLGDTRHPPTALAAWVHRGARGLLIAVGGSLYRYTLPDDLPIGAATGANVGQLARVAGGGAAPGAPGTPATQAHIQTIHAAAEDGEGRVWLRWDRWLGYIDDQGRLTAVAGGGALPPAPDLPPWDVRLTSTSAFHTPLAIDSDGAIVLAEPLYGAVLTLTPRRTDD